MSAVYLCGPILGRTDEDCVHWRERAAQLLDPIPVRDPVKLRDYRGKEHQDEAPEVIVLGDLKDINESACLLVMFDKPSVGTAMEIRYAFAERKIPVYVIDTSNSQRSPWLVFHTTRFFPTLEKACNFINIIHRRLLRPPETLVGDQRA